MTQRKPRIGFSACFFHPDKQRAVFTGKTLLYLEQSLANWLMAHGALPFLVPAPTGNVVLRDFLDDLDGLVLQGGVDVSPNMYQEDPLRPEWSGDAIRDRYELEVVRESIAADKPILGICRGAQLLNVALGGSLFQDIQTQNPEAQIHRCAESYDQLFHPIKFESGSLLEKLYGEVKGEHRVNSVHHQAVKTLGKRLIVEARSVPDGVVEAVRYDSPDRFIYGVQWHPEFQDRSNRDLLDPAPLLDHFLNEVRKRKRT